MVQIDMHQVQADLPRFLDQVQRGESILVSKDNVPIAEIRPVAPPRRTPRPIGLAKGEFQIPESFFDPLPDDFLAAFNGEKE